MWRHLRAAVGLVRLVFHLAQGVWTVRRHFAHWSASQREDAVQRWAQGGLRILGVALEVGGAPPCPGPVLLVANHISWVDILVLHALRHCRFVSKSEVRHWPVMGGLATAAGTLYIERESRRDAMRVVHHMAESLRAGEVVAVFPEGTTSDGTGVLPFHANLLQAAIVVQAPVQPVALSYLDRQTGGLTQAAAYVGDDSLLASLWRLLCAGGVVVRLTLGSPQTAQGRDRRQMARDLAQAVTELRQP